MANGCAAHDWGQMLTLRVKTCSHFRSFTSWNCDRTRAGNLGQCSDKSGPMIGKWVQSWDRPTNWPADELVPRVHCTLEMEIQEIRRASHV